MKLYYIIIYIPYTMAVSIELSIPVLSIFAILLSVTVFLNVLFTIYSYFLLKNKQYSPCKRK
jgi:hypothetical protein